MALTSTQKEKVAKVVKKHAKDTGSSQVQIALLSERIKRLTSHLGKNVKDFHSRRGLLQMVAHRRKLLAYLERTDDKAYKSILKKLGLKK